MVSSEHVVQLLTVLESANETDHITSLLQNEGHAVRSENVNTEQQLKEAIKKHSWDLIISSDDTSGINAKEVLNIVTLTRPDITTIVITDDFNTLSQLEILRNGARNYLPSKNDPLLLLTLNRELSDLRVRQQLQQAESNFKECEKRNWALLNSSRDAVAYIHEGMHIYSNTAYLDTFGFTSAEEIEAIPMMDLIAAEDADNFKKILRKLDEGSNPEEEFNFVAIRNNNDKFNATMTFSTASIEGEPCTQIVIRGHQVLKEELEKLRRQDLLTALYNRNYFTEKLEEEIAAATDNEKYVNSALIHIDLDGFKSISEKIGLVNSDLVLKDFANLINNQITEKDIAARFAGDIFTILLKQADIKKATSTAESVRKALIKHKFDIQDESFSCTASIGIVQISLKSDSGIKILSQAESACKVAKSNGGNTIYAYTLADEKVKDEEDHKWVQLINNALKQDDFYLLYQPIVALHGKEGSRYEVLVRLIDADNKQIMPDQFMGVAKKTGLLTMIDRWIIKHAVKEILPSIEKTDTQLFIKISSESIEEKSFLVWLNKLIKACHFPANRLVFALDETSIVNSMAKAKAFISNLKKLGCMTAINNAGHGKELFGFLNLVETEYIKIDPLFTSSLATSEQSQRIVDSIFSSAKQHGILSIAERVDDASTMAILWQSEIDFVQGDYLQSPNETLSYDFTAET
ncbi:MAG: EAL domain-containing protein [Gammaproteobacteria bacterium]|nr:EAL domain-containing protein [Gammaproteobacteria bacterium]